MRTKANLGAYGVMYVVKNKKSKVIALLLKNGVVVPNNATDIQIALLVTNLLKVSKSFYRDFFTLLLSQDVVAGMSVNMSGSYANFTGDANWCKDSANKTANPNAYELLCGKSTILTSTTTPKTEIKTKSESLFNQGLDFFQSSVKDYLQYDDNKTKRELANASVKLSENEIKKAEIILPKKGLSTGAIIGISLLGVTVVGLVVYLIVKNKNK